MRLIASIPASDPADGSAQGAFAHVTLTDAGWLIGLVMGDGNQRFVASHLVPPLHASLQPFALEHRLSALAVALRRETDPCDGTMKHVLDAFHVLAHRTDMPRSPGWHVLSSRQMQTAFEMLSARLDDAVYIADVAQACTLSEGQFRRAFRACTGISPQQWRQLRRIEYCRRELVETDESLATIARHAGFAAQSHFSRVFTQLTRMSPSEWRRIFRPAAKAGNTDVVGQEAIA